MSGKSDKTLFEQMLEKKIAAEEEKTKQKADDSAAEAASSDTETAGEEVASASENEAAPTAAAEIVDDDNSAAQGDDHAKQIADLQAEYDQMKDQWLRSRAEFDNYRKRILREMDTTKFNATADLLRVFLPVVDNLERALAHANEEDGLAEGVRLVHKQLLDLLAAQGVVAIEAKGQAFDPNIHDALSMTPSEEVEEGVILEEFERGYMLKDQVLRPSKVIVSAGKADDTAE